MTSTSPQNDLPVTVVVVNYNGRYFLDACLSSLRDQELPPREVILVDNASSDDSVAWARKNHPWIRVIEADENLGYCGGNNLGIQLSREPYVALLNNDTKVEPTWLRYLFEALEADPGAAASSSLVLLPGDPPRVHYAGSEAHFIGHISNLFYLKPRPGVEKSLVRREVGVYVGSSVLFRRRALDACGLLDDRFFIYEDELDMALRLRGRGWRILFVPESIVWHYAGTPELAVRTRQPYPSRRAFLVTRNRWLVLLKNYQLRTLLLLFPVLVLFELVWVCMLVRAGHGRALVHAYSWNWRHRARVGEQREAIQTARVVPDRLLLTTSPLSPVPGMIDRGIGLYLRKLGELKLKLYWRVVRPMLPT
jgi:GT2 family glycosyltransferase